MGLRARLPVHDTIGQLERAGQARFEESIVLAVRGRRHAAVYLLGYYVEITLKTIFFKGFGLQSTDPIRKEDLRAASQLVREQFKIEEDHEQYHNPVFWARAIIGLLELDDSMSSDALSKELVWRSQRVNSNWTVRMRYADDLALPEHWESLREDALWIRASRDRWAGNS